VIRIAITVEAFEAIASTLPLGSVGYQNEINERGERLIWLDHAVVARLRAMRGRGESYSDVILRIAVEGARHSLLAVAQSRPIPSLSDGVMLGAAWIDRPVDTQGCAPCFDVLLSAAWKRGHAQANDRRSSRVLAMPSRGFARTTRNG
jgi:hypothetical protein